MNKKKIAIIGDSKEFVSRSRIIGQILDIETHFFATADQFAENEDAAKEIDFIVLSAIESKKQSDTAGLVQTAKFMAPKATIVVVVEKKLKTEDAIFIKKSGANIVLLDDEYLTMSKVEFLIARYVHGEWISIKSYELISDTPLTFAIYHLMPLNQRMLPIVQPGNSLTKEKIEKLNSVGEFYIRQNDLNKYADFLRSYNDMSAAGLKRRCRAVYMQFVKTFKDLVLMLSDQSEAASYKEGSDLYQQLQKLSSEVMSQLGATGEAWDVINNSAMEDFTPVDRSTAIASYAGLISLMTGIGKSEDIMMAALISDIGILELHPLIMNKVRKKEFLSLSAEERAAYEKHPLLSVNRVLSRKIPLPENIKDAVLMSHENFSMKGFPNRVVPDKIPIDSYLIQFCEKMDQFAMVEFGKPRLSPNEVRVKVVDKEMMEKSLVFPPDLLQKIKNAFSS